MSLSPLIAGGAFGCESSEQRARVADDDLGSLVQKASVPPMEVDGDRLTESSEYFFQSVSYPHSWVGERLGAHLVTGTTKIRVSQGGSSLEDLSDTISLALDSAGRFAASIDNDREYGRHAIFDGKKLHLRPRFGPYHSRSPQSETEAVEIRNEIYASVTDYLSVFSSSIELSEESPAQHEGRSARIFTLKLAPEAKAPATHADLKQKQWRGKLVPKELSGRVALDSETGVVLALEFKGKAEVSRDGQTLLLELEGKRDISAIGTNPDIQAPPLEEQHAIPPRHRELAERDELLRNIAPPARRAPTPASEKP